MGSCGRLDGQSLRIGGLSATEITFTVYLVGVRMADDQIPSPRYTFSGISTLQYASVCFHSPFSLTALSFTFSLIASSISHSATKRQDSTEEDTPRRRHQEIESSQFNEKSSEKIS